MPASPSALGTVVQGSSRGSESWEFAKIESRGVRERGPGLGTFLILWGTFQGSGPFCLGLRAVPEWVIRRE